MRHRGWWIDVLLVLLAVVLIVGVLVVGWAHTTVDAY
jgi:hypothetical protein